MPRPYFWHELKKRGDHVFVPMTRANQVARLAKRYVARHLPEGSQVTTITTPEGTVTVLVYVPTVVEASRVPTRPRVEPPEPTTDKPRRTTGDSFKQAADPSARNKPQLTEQELHERQVGNTSRREQEGGWAEVPEDEEFD